MTDDVERQAFFIRKTHPPMPQAWMEEAMYHLAEAHAPSHAEVIATVPVTHCVLLSLLIEVLLYRNKYGLLELPATEEYYQHQDGEVEP